MTATVMGSFTVDRRSSASPGIGGDTMLKVTSPVAVPLKAAPSDRTYTYSARKPDQGHSRSLCSKRTSRNLPPSFVAVNSGSPSNVPAVKVGLRATQP